MWRKRARTIDDSERVVRDRDRSRQRTFDRAVRLLAARPRSVEELRRRLLEKLWTDTEIVDGVIERLKEYGYLDDAQYARDLAISKLRQKPQGRRRLQYDMAQKQLDRETVAAAVTNAFETLPESELIDAAIEKRIKLKGPPATHDERKRLVDHLLRRGFGYELIREKLHQLSGASSEE